MEKGENTFKTLYSMGINILSQIDSWIKVALVYIVYGIKCHLP